MKIKKLGAVLFAAVMACSVLTACGGGGGSSSEDDAIKKTFKAVQGGDYEKVATAMMPSELWDYIVKKSGVPAERAFYKYGNFDDASKWKEIADYAKDNYDLSKISEKSTSEESDRGYQAFNKALDNAGIKDDIEVLYYADLTGLPDGFLYKVGGKWYFGPESILEDMIEAAEE